MLKGAKCFSPKCPVVRRHSPPGQHGTARRKVSEYSLQLKEKQKARYVYGILERQFRRHYAEAERRPGLSGENLLQILEMRLDNVAYRLGFADSRRQSRQLVLHGHITLNGRVTNIPSCSVKPGDTCRLQGFPKTVSLDVNDLAIQRVVYHRRYIDIEVQSKQDLLSKDVIDNTPTKNLNIVGREDAPHELFYQV